MKKVTLAQVLNILFSRLSCNMNQINISNFTILLKSILTKVCQVICLNYIHILVRSSYTFTLFDIHYKHMVYKKQQISMNSKFYNAIRINFIIYIAFSQNRIRKRLLTIPSSVAITIDTEKIIRYSHVKELLL